MAATTKLIQLRPKTLPITTTTKTTTSTPTLIHFFSSSNTPDPNNTPSPQPSPPSPPTQSHSPSSSYFSDLKASLKQQQHQRRPQSQSQSQPPRNPFCVASFLSNQTNPPSKIASLQEIRRNLLEFRRRSAAPSPSSTSSTSASHSLQHISFQELFQQSVLSKAEESAPNASKASGKLPYEAIRESLRQLQSSPSKNQGEGGGGTNNPMSLSRFKENLTMRTMDPSVNSSPQRVLGDSDHLPLSIFGEEIRKKEEGDSSTDAKMRTEFFRTYTTEEVGEKLRALRPEKRDKKDWFSLEELSERLVKLREMEEKDSDSKVLGIVFKDIREGLQTLGSLRKEEKSPIPRFDILELLGRTPDYMLSPPKEELVEQYFHLDNMSASEKLKLELRKVRDEFKLSESDCGSARVQVAQLTKKIKHLSTALLKKDKHSQKGLEAMVQRRKKLLKYLRRTDWDSYCFVLSKLGLRDNTDDFAKKKKYPSKKRAILPEKRPLKIRTAWLTVFARWHRIHSRETG